MRCLSCNCILTNFEATRKYENGEYVDLCNSCLNKSDMKDILLVEREDLKGTDDVEDFDNLEEF